MRLLTAKGKKVIRDSAQTFAFAAILISFAIALTFVEDWCIKTQRPSWLVYGIASLSMIMFVTDALVLSAICARVLAVELRELRREVRGE
jgi:hypothetical protein